MVCADIGAGTGIWTSILANRGIRCIAVEPNDEMRREGIEATAGLGIEWRHGTAEETDLEASSVDWVTMASSFHWTDTSQSLPEFHRILRPSGRFTALWNPRDLALKEDEESVDREVEGIIRKIVPGLKRVSSGYSEFTDNLGNILLESGLFMDVRYDEDTHEERRTPKDYMGVWRSVNDIQAQAGPERFARILDEIARLIEGHDVIVTRYKTRAWTARRRDNPQV